LLQPAITFIFLSDGHHQKQHGHALLSACYPGFMKAMLLYCLCCNLLLCMACSTPKEIFITEEFRNNNRSSEIYTHYFKEVLLNFLEYRAYHDTVLYSSQADSTVNFGLISNRVSYRLYHAENKVLFGTDSQQCVIQYTSSLKYRTSEPAMINLFGKKDPYSSEQQTQTSLSYASIAGTIQSPACNTPIPFLLDNYRGYLLLDSDSLILKPIMQGKKLMATLVGVQLVKGDTVYAAIHSFTGLFRKKIFLYTKIPASQTLLVAAYCGIISRYL
jgi:hypothetical protein